MIHDLNIHESPRDAARTLAPVLAAGLLCGCSGSQAPATTTLVVHVTDAATGVPVPAVLVLYDELGDPVRIGALDWEGYTQSRGYCELSSGAVGTWEGVALAYGSAEIPIGTDGCEPGPAVPHGHYAVRVMRGIEYEFFETTVDLSPDRGPVVIEAPLLRAFAPDGMLAADLHVHSENSGDSDVPRWVRVITEAAAGIQVIGATDHDFHTDFADVIEELQMGAFVASVPGNEVSGAFGHFGVYPVVVAPERPRGGAMSKAEAQALSSDALFSALHALPGQPLIQVNHPRLRWAAYFDSARWDGVSWPPPFSLAFDTLEVLSGFLAFNAPGDDRVDEMVRDFYTFARNGTFVTAVGNSDTHHLHGILAGLPRSYVRVRAPSPASLDTEDFIDALRNRHVVATTGPWLDVRVMGSAGPGDVATVNGRVIPVEVSVRQASFVRATRMRVWVGGELRHTVDIPEGALAFDWTSDEPIAGDSWIGVDVSGDEPLPVELTGDRLAEQGNVVPFALINPILIDADGDGRIDIVPPAAPTAPPVTMLDLLPRVVPPGHDSGHDCGCDWQ